MDVRPLPAHFHLQAFANSLSLLCVRRGGDDAWTTSFPANHVLPALPLSQHTHSASSRGARSLSPWGPISAQIRGAKGPARRVSQKRREESLKMGT